MRFSLLFAVGLFFVCLPRYIAAQVPCPPAGIETDPTHATNPGGAPNTFNWYYGNYQPGTYNGRRYQLNSSATTQSSIELPWQQPGNINMERFQGKNDIPANGWELIRRDLGYDDAGNPTATKNPTVILYNRYLGVLRVFVAVGQQFNGYQLAEIKLVFSEFAQKKAGTLNRQSALGVALEDTEPGLNSKFSAIARYLNDGGKWFVGDFPMDYDPCVCLFDSRLRIEVNLIENLSVDLQGQTTGTITTANGSTTGNSSNGVPFVRRVNGAIVAGGTSFDNVDKLVSKTGATFTAELKKNSFLQNGMAAVPWLGAAVGLLDFFVGGGQDSAPQPLALQPLAIEMSTRTTGTISASNLYATVPFNNPGNRLASTLPENTPYYNEAMGIFSLLQRPVVDFTTKTTITGTTRTSMVRETDQYFRLTQDLAYVINPASGLTVQDFQVALVAEGGTEFDQAPGGDFTVFEGSSIQDDGTHRNAYRTPYYDASCIKKNIFLWSSIYQNGYYDTTTPRTIYIKIMVNLHPNNAPATQQNVLFVARYRANFNNVASHTRLPNVSCGVLPQASASIVQTVCNGSKYTTAVALPRHSQIVTKATGDAAKRDAANSSHYIVVYPNPAMATVQFRFTTTQPGHVRMVLSDALGREVRQVVDISNAAVGTFEATTTVADLRPGIYYCTLQTPGERVVQKLVVSQ